jgi:hypothetical protein
MPADPARAARIAALNDAFRRTMGALGGRVMQTRGIAALPPADQAAIQAQVAAYDAFTPANDPYGEHDFGAFAHQGEHIFWKIDYYDHTLEYGSDDPSRPEITTRVLTIMLAHEY